MGHHKTVQYMHYGNPRRRKKERESLFEEIKAENFLNLRNEMDIQIQETQTLQL